MGGGGVAVVVGSTALCVLPMPIESLGGWHLGTWGCLAAKAMQTGKDEDVAVPHLFQKVSVLLVRGNDALLLNRLPS